MEALSGVFKLICDPITYFGESTEMERPPLLVYPHAFWSEAFPLFWCILPHSGVSLPAAHK